MRYLILVVMVLCLAHLAYGTTKLDWLIHKIDTPTKLIKTTRQSIILSNGLISREFSIVPGFTTIDYYTHQKKASILRALSPEAVISLDGLYYNIGNVIADIPKGYLNRTALYDNWKADPDAFHMVSMKTGTPEAPYPYSPKRGAPVNITWPPAGLRLDVTFKAPFGAPKYHQDVEVVIHYEMYDGIPLMCKWISATASGIAKGNVNMQILSVEYLAVNMPWGSAVMERYGHVLDYHKYIGNKWLHIQTDEIHGTGATWSLGPAYEDMPGSFPPVVNCTYGTVPTLVLTDVPFASFKTQELMIDSSDPERVGLSKNKMMRLLAPQTQENPIFFHMTNSESTAFRNVVDELVEVGFEMIIYSFGSGFDIESLNETYIQQVAADIAYANRKGIEVGGYDLIDESRTVKPEWMAIDPNTMKPTTSACFASGWYDFLLDRFTSFIDKTNLTMVETDGPYGGWTCGSKNHSHHDGVGDSQYKQEMLQSHFFKMLRAKSVYINQPDYFFYQGGSKTGLGYNEDQFSLPRWQDISISRQSVYDNTYKMIPTAGWMFVPLVDYHAGGDAAKFEPLQQNLQAYKMAMSQYLGAGVAACYRGYRVFDTNETKAMVTNMVSFYKEYRDIITSDIVHIRRPDMQDIDAFIHVNPHLETKGLMMVFNPLDVKMSTMLEVPLYYTGLTDTANVSLLGRTSETYTLERDYTIDVPVNLEPNSATWYLIS